MRKIDESAIETLAIERLQTLGFDYVYAPEIAPDSSNPERTSFTDVLLLSRLRNAVTRINPTLPSAALDEAIKNRWGKSSFGERMRCKTIVTVDDKTS